MRGWKRLRSVQRPFSDHDMPGVARDAIFNMPHATVRMYRRQEGESSQGKLKERMQACTASTSASTPSAVSRRTWA